MFLDLITIWVCKASYRLLRIFGRHGGALPGVIAEKLRPNLIQKLTQLPEGIVVVSGTNGKTTTTHLLSQVLKASGMHVFTNHSGSNMTRGILSSIVRFTTISGKLNYDVAVLEIDEAYAAILGPKLKPRGVLLTNVLRDQLDRFGEIDHTAKMLYKLAESADNIVVYNTSDSRLQKLNSIKTRAKKYSYGYSSKLSEHFVDDDTLYGGDKVEQKADYILSSYKNQFVKVNNISIPLDHLSGWHNALNLVGVYVIAKELFGVIDIDIYKKLTPPYGRGEAVEYKNSNIILQLVKNPAGFRTVIGINSDYPALIIVNDNIADGKDVSWFWDVDFRSMSSRKFINCSGTRAYDMALRLKYDDLSADDINTQIGEALDNFVSKTDKGVVFLTYTSMLQARTYLKSRGAKLGV